MLTEGQKNQYLTWPYLCPYSCTLP